MSFMALNAPLPGVALLSALLERHQMTRAEFARRASRHGVRVDRVTIVQMLEGVTRRVAVPVAVAIREASSDLGDAIPVEAWMVRDIEHVAATGTDG